ncbi:MAG: 4Fe-4S dicluster domain-containing protein [Calditrichota bacterium]
MAKTTAKATPVILKDKDLQKLFEILQSKGWATIGPCIRDGAIVLDELQSADDLPIGRTDEQSGGHYRLKPRNDRAHFGYNVGPRSAKGFLHVPRATIWQGQSADWSHATPSDGPLPKLAFIGIRPCELKAIFVQDEVLLRGPYGDAIYTARRKNLFFVVVNCTEAGGTCFCSSMKTGPKADGGYDIAITELLENGEPRFLLQAGSRRGDDLLKDLPTTEAKTADLEQAEQGYQQAANSMGRHLETNGIRDLLFDNSEHPRWDETAERCLGCANCTMVCPTCFCVTVEDSTSLDGKTAQRERRWDSCFTLDFSYIHGGSIRQSSKSRYRQWMTHKLAAWHDQFGMSGCVGCGRCITWCPVGIDITEEAAVIRHSARIKEATDGND